TTDGANFVYFNPHWLHEQLANNVIEYRLRFADRVHALLDNGGLLTQQKASALMASLADQIDMAIIAESARWGDSTSSTPRTKANWLDALQFTYNWINGTSSVLSTNGTLNARQDWPKYPREQRLKEQFRSVGWYSELESPVLSSYGGKVETDYQLTMSNPNGRGVMYYTTDGSDPRELSSDVNVNDTVLIAENASKYVLVPTANVLKPTGNVLAEVYNNIQGNDLASLTSSVNYPANPNYRELWPSLAMPAINHDENYGTRVRAILYPPTTGYYTFWITSDDNSSLRLSSDASPANAVEIAYLATWSNSNEWYKETSQQSEQIYLEYNRPYYLEALHKEGTGGDNLNIGWSGPGISGPTVIPGQYLSVPENVWASVNYVPAGWISGAGAVGYENRPGEAVNYSGYINTGINLQSQMYNKATSCYIRIPFSYTSSDINSLKLNLRYDDGCVVYLNGIEVYRDNVDGVVLNWNSQADLPRDDSISIAITQVDISQNIDLLRNGNNVLAIQGLNDAAGSSDMLISASLVAGVQDPGQVSALAEEYAGPVTLNISKEINTRIFDGLEWSPLTKASFSVGPVSESLRITELMYHSELNGVEFLEIRNIGASAVNLNKVSFIKGISHIFGDLWLEPDQFIVLTQDSIAFAGRYPALPADCIVLQWDSGLLNNAGEEIVFCDASGEVIQAFEYNDWYDLTDGGGFTMNMPDPAQADLSLWSQKESWAVSTYAGGSPGELDEALTGNSIVINEVMSNPTEGMPDWVELKNNTSMPINIGGWYLSDSNSDLLKYQIEQGTVVPASGYLVLYDEMSFGSSLGLSKFGENLTLSSAVNGVLTGYQVSED
ncbi:MAG: lamin tail domain-containing protein, partial [Sedimentisphaerales bacterium]|nr:lamin tail domain-containing protein [Sedimentisphaerales bacterium]